MPNHAPSHDHVADAVTSTTAGRAPGKATLTQRMTTRAVPPAAPVRPARDPVAAAVQRQQIAHDLAAACGFFGGPAASIDASLAQLPVQASGDRHTGLDDATISARAAHGVSGSGGALPHLDAIQRAFGPAHDLTGVRAHVGGAAADAATAIGAHAYATGNDVAFASAPDLFLAAHEATHVVQQRQGVSLKGAVGQAGDRYEQHADEVAAAVVRGDSVGELLGGGGVSGAGPVQRQAMPRAVELADGPAPAPTARQLATGSFDGAAGAPTPPAMEVRKGATGEVRFRFDRPPLDRGTITVRSSVTPFGMPIALGARTYNSGDAAMDVDPGRWDGDELVWKVVPHRPGSAYVRFTVLDGGTVVAQRDQNIVSAGWTGADAGALMGPVEAHLQSFFAKVSAHRMKVAGHYNIAYQRYSSALATDKKNADATAAAIMEVVTAALFAFGGTWGASLGKSIASKSDYVKDFMKDLFKGIQKGVVKGVTGQTEDHGVTGPEDPLAFFLSGQSEALRMQECAAPLLLAWQQRLERQAEIDLDPLTELAGAMQRQSPTTAPSVDDFERGLWREWYRTHGNGGLETWYGLNATATMARLTALGITFRHPDDPRDEW